jgi:O-antigen biosynthesis protein
MPNLLFISKNIPSLIKSAGDIRALKMLQILSEKYSIDVVARIADYGDSDIKRFGCIPHLTKDIKNETKNIIENKNPKIIIISHWSISEEIIDFIKNISNAKIIIDSIDLEYLRLYRKMQYDNSISKEQVEIIKNRELNIYKKADAIIMASKIDEEQLLIENNFKTILLPCLFEINNNYKTNNGKNSYIICNWSHEPNIIITKYLCKEIIYNIDTIFHIVGKHPPKEIVDFNNEKNLICGAEYEIKKFLNRMNFHFCPILYGAGINGKIGEALAFGIPVITNSLGANPYGLIHEETAMIAENTTEFIYSFNKLLNDNKLCEKLSFNSRKLMLKFTIEYWKEDFLKRVTE